MEQQNDIVKSKNCATSRHIPTPKNEVKINVPQPKEVYIEVQRAIKRKAAEPLLTNSPIDLAAKRAKLQQALTSKPASVVAKSSNQVKAGSYKPIVHVIKNVRATNRPPTHDAILPVSTKIVATPTSGVSSIHGRKSLTIREQQQRQMGRTQEIISRLKAEQENKKPSSPRLLRQRQNIPTDTSIIEKRKHAAAFGSLTSKSRLNFEFIDEVQGDDI